MDDLANQLIDAAIANDGSKFPAIEEQIDGLALSMRSLGERYNEMAAALGPTGIKPLCVGQRADPLSGHRTGVRICCRRH